MRGAIPGLSARDNFNVESKRNAVLFEDLKGTAFAATRCFRLPRQRRGKQHHIAVAQRKADRELQLLFPRRGVQRMRFRDDLAHIHPCSFGR